MSLAESLDACSSPYLTIGQVADRFGTAPSVLRFWERLGLIEPEQRQSGARRYGPESLLRIALIQLCKAAGFSLQETSAIYEIHDRSERQRLISAKISAVDSAIAELELSKTTLLHMSRCPADHPFECPVFRSKLEDRAAVHLG